MLYIKRVFPICVCLWLLFACNSEPTEIAVQDVYLSQDRAEMIVGETVQLEAIIYPSNATDKKIYWASSKQSVAGVSDRGHVTAIEPGVTTVSAFAGGKKADCLITVMPKTILVSSITVDPTTLSLTEGDRGVIIAIVNPEDASDKSIEWMSSDTSVAIVDNYGNVSAVSAGTTFIYATVGGQSACCQVSVSKRAIAVSSISLNINTLYLEIGANESLLASVEPENATNKEVFWNSSNESVAIVSQLGLVSALSAGEAIITAKAGEYSAICNVVVNEPITIEAIDVGLSVKWGSCNLGSSTPEGKGDFYAWGEVETYYQSGSSLNNPVWRNGKEEGYTWGSYVFGHDYRSLIKYCPVGMSDYWGGEREPDGKTALELEDDAANIRLGGQWRIPTSEEWMELIDKCSWEWAEQDGVYGFIISGQNDARIFLPAAGYFLERYYQSMSTTKVGCYWSASLDKNSPQRAKGLYFEGGYEISVDSDGRCFGRLIRPVVDY